MMRTTELRQLAEKWGITFMSIKELQNYRKCHDHLVDKMAEVSLPTKFGNFRAYGFVNRLNGEHHIAMNYADFFFIEAVRKLCGDEFLFW